MTIISAAHVLRLTVRLEFTDSPVSVDVAIPVGSSLLEVFDEIVALADIDAVTEPWCAVTVAGQEVDLVVPVGQAQLVDGDVVVLQPAVPVAPPVVRDAAEYVADLTQAARPAVGTVAGAAVVGFWGLVVLSLRVPLPEGIPVVARLVVPVVVAVGVLVWTRAVLLVPMVVVGLGVLVLLVVVDPHTTPITAHMSDREFARLWALACVCAGLVMIVSAIVCQFIAPSIRMMSALITVASCVIIMSIGACFYYPPATAPTDPTWSWLVNALALVVAVGACAVAFSPLLSIKIARVQIPVLPTSGQDLSVSDTNMDDVPRQAQVAHAVLEGIVLGLGCALVPAILVVCAWAPQRHFSFALAVCLCLSFMLHAQRHHGWLSTWALWLPALAAAGGTALVATAPGTHVAVIILAFLVVSAAATAPGWAPHLTNLEPTTVVWIERAEVLSIAACLPLALHIVGLFTLLRGLAL